MADRMRETVMFGILAAALVWAPLAGGAVEWWSFIPSQAAILLLLLMVAWRRASPLVSSRRRTPLDVPLVLFMGLMLVSAWRGVYPALSVINILQALTYGCAYYVAVDLLGRGWREQMCLTIVGIGVVLSLVGLGQYFFGFEHGWWSNPKVMSASYVNHNHFAGYLEMAIPIAVAFLFSMRSKGLMGWLSLRAMLLAGALVVMAAGFLFAQSRGGWISLALAFLVYNGVLVYRKELPRWTVGIFLVILGFTAIYLYGGTDNVAERLQTVEEVGQEMSWGTRLKLWGAAGEMLAEHPLTGVGPGGFQAAFRQYRPEGLNVFGDFTHNDYLQALVELGWGALGLLLWIVVVLVRWGLSRMDGDRVSTAHLRLGMGIGLLSLLFHGMVDFNFSIGANMLTFAVIAGMVMRPRRKLIQAR